MIIDNQGLAFDFLHEVVNAEDKKNMQEKCKNFASMIKIEPEDDPNSITTSNIVSYAQFDFFDLSELTDQ